MGSHIYVAADAKDAWDAARELAGDDEKSLSRVVNEALKAHIQANQAQVQRARHRSAQMREIAAKYNAGGPDSVTKAEMKTFMDERQRQVIDGWLNDRYVRAPREDATLSFEGGDEAA